MEAFPVRKSELPTRVFLRHMDKLRLAIPQVYHAIFVIAPECNMGLQANELAVAVQEHTKITKMHQLKDVLITLNRSPNQYFKNKFRGIERNGMSTKYQLKAVSQFNFPSYYKIEILAKFLWSIIIETKEKLKSNE